MVPHNGIYNALFYIIIYGNIVSRHSFTKKKSSENVTLTTHDSHIRSHTLPFKGHFSSTLNNYKVL